MPKNTAACASACVALLVVAGGVNRVAHAQQKPRWQSPGWVGSFQDEDRRLGQLMGKVPLSSRLIRPLVRDTAAADSGASVALYYPLTRATYNNAVPYG